MQRILSMNTCLVNWSVELIVQALLLSQWLSQAWSSDSCTFEQAEEVTLNQVLTMHSTGTGGACLLNIHPLHMTHPKGSVSGATLIVAI